MKLKRHQKTSSIFYLPSLQFQLTMGVQAERRRRRTTLWPSKKNPEKEKGSKPCFPFPHGAEIRKRRRITVTQVFWLLRLYGSTRLSLNPKPKNEIWPIKMFLTSRSWIWWTDFTVTAGKLRRCWVRETQQKFNPNPFSSWFLSQIKFLITEWGHFSFRRCLFYCGCQK